MVSHMACIFICSYKCIWILFENFVIYYIFPHKWIIKGIQKHCWLFDKRNSIIGRTFSNILICIWISIQWYSYKLVVSNIRWGSFIQLLLKINSKFLLKIRLHYIKILPNSIKLIFTQCSVISTIQRIFKIFQHIPFFDGCLNTDSSR